MLLALGVFGSAVGTAESGRDREWAEAMLNLRSDYRENGLKKGAAKRQIKMSLTGKVFEQMLADYPYRTDWMLQDTGNNLKAWLNQTGDAVVERGLLQKFQGLEKPQGGTDDPRWLELYAMAAEQRRFKRLEKLRREFPRIVFTKNHTIMPSFFAYTEGQSDAQSERHFTPGTALCMLEWDGAYAKTSDLIADPHGRIRDPEVSFDGKKILFSWKKSDRLDDYHLHELDRETGQVRQLTFGLGVADFEPCYLPGGDIVFSSSRCVQTVDCWKTEVSNLYTCGPNGEYLRRLGFDQVHTVKPALLDDGRVIYTRWDYSDRGQVFPQGLFQMNPDGTGQTEFYGNNSWFPTTLSHARGIPGSSRVVAVAHGHHTWQAGELVLVDVAKGRQEAAGVQLIAPIRETEAVRVDAYGQQGDLFQYPYPINENEFLVAYSPLGGRPTRFAIYYMDVDGNRELLAGDPSISCQHPVPLKERKRPPARPSRVDYTQDSGAYYMQDIYFGPGLKGVERGTIKKLRLVELDFRAAWIGHNNSRGPAGSAQVSTPVSIGNGTWDVKRVIGDAEVYPDGSAYFEAPARTPLYFQALDENNRAVQTMRSWTTLQPGETFSCIGCHEEKDSAPLQQPVSMALKAGVQQLEPFHGPPRGFSFLKEIQPILDAKCVGCHEKEGKMILDRTVVLDKNAKRRWTRSYLNLTESVRIGGNGPYIGTDAKGLCVWVSSQSVPDMIPPYSVGSTVSPLIDQLLKGHGEPTREELDKFIAWVDLGVPFCGDYYEAGEWTLGETALYDRYQAKRARLAALDEQNIQALLAGQPIVPASQNRYRNMALEATATASSECRSEACFAAGNVVDGDRRNTGHGKEFPSWGPDKADGLWLKLEWKEEVYVDRLNIHIRADFKKDHDSWWKSGTVELSNGRKIPFKLNKTAAVQVIEIPVRKWPPEPIRWLRFNDLVPAEDKWCGFTEVEAMGCAAK